MSQEPLELRENLVDIKRDWHNCVRCPLGLPARHHVLYENIRLWSECLTVDQIIPGEVDMMIVGEGPGQSEDVIGRPFIGESGKLLRETLLEACSSQNSVRICLSNLLACRPWAQAPTKSANRAPTQEEVEACHPRLVSLLNTLRPKVVVAAGREADIYLPEIIQLSKVKDVIYYQVPHPAWILRNSKRDLAREVYTDTFVKILKSLEQS